MQRNRLHPTPLQCVASCNATRYNATRYNALHVATQPVVRRARVAEVVRLPAKVDAVA